MKARHYSCVAVLGVVFLVGFMIGGGLVDLADKIFQFNTRIVQVLTMASTCAFVAAIVFLNIFVNDIERLSWDVQRLEIDLSTKARSYDWASACYLQAILENGCAGTKLEREHVRYGLRYLAVQIQEVSETNIALQQGWLNKSKEDTPGPQKEKEFQDELEERSKKARQAFWDVRDRLVALDIEGLEGLKQIKTWKECILVLS